ncbi:MAG TPA: zf-HC2 domain-containing protein, partial [Acidimicrobiia bacterium]|nr:zf-HC2 domain-containing protein [Acidimicrobiia bacterium]
MTDFLGARDDHDFLSGYLDGELTADERAGVEAQLATSAELRAELADVTAARDAVRGLPRREAPAGFWDAVLATVAADPV